MKIAVNLLIALALATSVSAQAKDIFFYDTDSAFVRTTPTSRNGKPWVTYEACKIVDAATQTAECEALASLSVDEIVSMRKCLKAEKIAAGTAVVAGGAAALFGSAAFLAGLALEEFVVSI